MTNTEQAAKIAFFYDHIYETWWLIPALAFLAVVLSAVIVAIARNRPKSAAWRKSAILLLAAWIIGPPVWFLAEYYMMQLRPVESLPDIEAFKYNQDLSSKIWIAAVALLVAMYRRSVPGPDL
jgi:hypothetical protein